MFSWPVVAIFATAIVVAALRQSIWAGVQATVWTALLASLAFFAIAVAEAVLWYRDAASLILAGDAVRFDAVGENIRFWTPFGVIGAAIGRAGRARLSRAG